MGKRKKGSGLVIVLGVTMVLILLSGVILKFTLGTTKSNVSQKETEDVSFAADGGIELARSYLQTKSTSPLPGGATVAPPGYYEFNTETVGGTTENLAVELETNKIANVEIKSQELGNDKVLITSTATDIDGKKDTVKCKFEIYQKSENNIFDYGIVGGQGNVHIANSEGGRNNISSLISSTTIEDDKGNPTNNIVPNENGSQPTVQKNKFGDLTFLTNDQPLPNIVAKYGGAPHITLVSGEFYDGDGSGANKINPTIIDADLDNPTKIKVTNGSDVKEFNVADLGNRNNIPSGFHLEHVVIMNVKGHGTRGNIEMLMTNTQNLKIETVGGSAIDAINVAFLNKGIIEFGGTGSIKLTDSTMYGEEIKADLKLGFHVTGSLKNGLSDPRESILNGLIAAIMPGWNNITNNSAGGITVINGSFVNE